MKIDFTVTGSIEQTIELTKDCTLTAKQVEDALNGIGEAVAWTSLDDNGAILYKPDEETETSIIGYIVDQETNLEFDSFDVYN